MLFRSEREHIDVVNIIKAKISKYTNELKDYSPDVLVKIGDCIAYPGESAVQSARFYSAQQFYDWNVFIMQPILHLNKIQAELVEEVKVINQLLQTDPIFRENHQNDDINELARSRIKSRKWFKDVVDKIYEAILQDQNSFNKLLIAIQKKFIEDYKAYTNNKLLLNEDKVYSLNKTLKSSNIPPLKKNVFDFVDNEDADDEINSLTEEFSSQVSQETTAETSPIKSVKKEQTPKQEKTKPTSTRRIFTNKGSRQNKNINIEDKEEEKHEIKDDNESEDKSEFQDDDD